METTEGNTGTATTQRTINALNLKSIILYHSPAGAREASDIIRSKNDLTTTSMGTGYSSTGLSVSLAANSTYKN